MKIHLKNQEKVALCGAIIHEKMEVDIARVDCKNCLKQIERIGCNRIKYDYYRNRFIKKGAK
jgi:hypothetical protein